MWWFTIVTSRFFRGENRNRVPPFVIVFMTLYTGLTKGIVSGGEIPFSEIISEKSRPLSVTRVV